MHESAPGDASVAPSGARRPDGRLFIGVRPSGWFAEDGREAPTRLVEWAVRAEELGFDAAFVGDRLLSEGRSSQRVVYGAAMLDPFVVLTAMAAKTSSINLAPLVAVIPFRHPVYMAKITASLDLVSQGRFILGAGAGWSDPELQLFGIERRTRGARMEEGIRLVRELWTGEAVSSTGPFWHLDDVRVLPRPWQRPGPPVWLGSFAPDDRRLWVEGDLTGQVAPLRRIGRISDAWVPLTYSAGYMTQLTPSMLAESRAVIAEGAVEAGRQPSEVKTIYAHWIAVVRNDAERRSCEAALRRFFRGSFEDARKTYLIGTADEIVEHVMKHTALLGQVDGYLFTPIEDSSSQLEAVAAQVRPLLASATGRQVDTPSVGSV